jgi:hypothetical protein
MIVIANKRRARQLYIRERMIRVPISLKNPATNPMQVPNIRPIRTDRNPTAIEILDP